jgi:hypothetical protein
MGGLISKGEIVAVQICDISSRKYRGKYIVKIKWNNGKIETWYDLHESVHMKLAEYKKKQGFISVPPTNDAAINNNHSYKGKSIVSDEWITLDEALIRFKDGYSYYNSVKPLTAEGQSVENQ